MLFEHDFVSVGPGRGPESSAVPVEHDSQLLGRYLIEIGKEIASARPSKLPLGGLMRNLKRGLRETKLEAITLQPELERVFRFVERATVPVLVVRMLVCFNGHSVVSRGPHECVYQTESTISRGTFHREIFAVLELLDDIGGVTQMLCNRYWIECAGSPCRERHEGYDGYPFLVYSFIFDGDLHAFRNKAGFLSHPRTTFILPAFSAWRRQSMIFSLR